MEAPTVTLMLTVPDLLRVATGQLNPVEAYLNGKLRMSGDNVFGQRLELLFDI